MQDRSQFVAVISTDPVGLTFVEGLKQHEGFADEN